MCDVFFGIHSCHVKMPFKTNFYQFFFVNSPGSLYDGVGGLHLLGPPVGDLHDRTRIAHNSANAARQSAGIRSWSKPTQLHSLWSGPDVVHANREGTGAVIVRICSSLFAAHEAKQQTDENEWAFVEWKQLAKQDRDAGGHSLFLALTFVFRSPVIFLLRRWQVNLAIISDDLIIFKWLFFSWFVSCKNHTRFSDC